MKIIGIIGDSVAHGYYDEKDLGWFARLGKMLLSEQPGKYIFNNMSQSGDNIADVTNRAVYEVLSRHFDLLLVNVGINDLRRRENSALQLDFSEGARIMYWNKLLDTLALTHAKVVVLDLLPVIEGRYTPDVERYNQIIKEICAQRKINFFARYDQWKNKDLNELYKDAIHPNSAGYQIMAEEVLAYLKENNLL